jgi:cobalt-zinc-cadmium efflux system protein
MTRAARLIIVLALNLALVAALLAVGVAAHSLALLAAGGDYLLDAAAVGVALVALWLSARARRNPSARPYPDAGAWAALVNASWLLLLEVLVVAGAIDRLVTGVPAVHGLPVLILSGVAAIAMAASALVLGGDLDDDDGDDDDDDNNNNNNNNEDRGHRLSVQAILLDAGADAAAAAGVAVAGAIIWAAHGVYWLDPAVALVIAVVISWHAAKLLTRVRRTLVTRRSLWQIDSLQV